MPETTDLARPAAWIAPEILRARASARPGVSRPDTMAYEKVMLRMSRPSGPGQISYHKVPFAPYCPGDEGECPDDAAGTRVVDRPVRPIEAVRTQSEGAGRGQVHRAGGRGAAIGALLHGATAAGSGSGADRGADAHSPTRAGSRGGARAAGYAGTEPTPAMGPWDLHRGTAA